MELRGLSVLVTGASGFIGGRLAALSFLQRRVKGHLRSFDLLGKGDGRHV
jgi:nucleoside-diphosphate-sugar epimerase